MKRIICFLFYGVILTILAILPLAQKYQKKMAVEPLPAWALKPHVPSVDDSIVTSWYGYTESDLLREVTVFDDPHGTNWVKRVKILVSQRDPFLPLRDWTDFRDGGASSSPFVGCRQLPRKSVKINGEWYESDTDPGTDCQWMKAHSREVMRAVYGH